MNNNTCELVVAIVNHGFEDEVMTAARAAGARGGTVFNARGTANSDDEVKFLGITLHPNKEIIFILTEQKTKTETTVEKTDGETVTETEIETDTETETETDN